MAERMDSLKQEPIRTPSPAVLRRRGGISDASMGPPKFGAVSEYKREKHAKSPEDLARLKSSLDKNILFSHMEEDDYEEILDSFFPKEMKANALIIRQGDSGDFFYVIDEGSVDISKSSAGGPEVYLCTLEKPASFGELALMFGMPRAASVRAKTDGRLWAISREVYRHVLMDLQIQKRRRYEDSLKRVPLLATLTEWEMTNIADVLVPIRYDKDEIIVRQGAPGDTFFILLEGSVVCLQQAPQSTEQIEVSRLMPGSYFGEIALLVNLPRAATVKAVTDKVKCATLDISTFRRVLGPCEDVLRRNIRAYNSLVPLPTE